jgi:hypothetical protein
VKSMAELVVGADTLNRVLSPLLACTSNGLPTLKIGIGSEGERESLRWKEEKIIKWTNK